MILEHYTQLEKQYENQQSTFNKKINNVAILRLFSIISLLFCLYQYYNNQAILFIVLALIALIAFLRLLTLHLKYKQEAQLLGLLKTI